MKTVKEGKVGRENEQEVDIDIDGRVTVRFIFTEYTVNNSG